MRTRIKESLVGYESIGGSISSGRRVMLEAGQKIEINLPERNRCKQPDFGQETTVRCDGKVDVAVPDHKISLLARPLIFADWCCRSAENPI